MIRLGLALSLLFCSVLLASIDDLSYSTLKQGQGIRAISMGRAYTATGVGGGGIYYNPAGVSHPQAESQVSYENYDTDDSHVELHRLTAIYVPPFSYNRLRKELLNGQHLSLNTLTYGKSNGRMDWGINYHQINRSGDLTLDGKTIDFGLIYRYAPRLHFGAVVKDIYTKDIDVPTNLVTGLRYFSYTGNWEITADLYQDRRNFDDVTWHARAGVEWKLAEGLWVRAGLNERERNAGLGFIFPIFQLDVGMVQTTKGFVETNIPGETGTQYMFGISFGGANQATPNHHPYSRRS